MTAHNSSKEMHQADKVDQYLNQELQGTELEKFEEHIFNCKACSQKLRAADEMMRLLKNEGAVLFAEDIEKLKRQKVVPEAQKRNKKRFPSIFRFPKPAFGWASAVIATFAVVIILLQTNSGEKQTIVTREPTIQSEEMKIEPVFPENGSAISAEHPEFRWTAYPNVKAYHFVLFDDDGDIIWRTETEERNLVLSDEITLEPGMTYFWQIEARMGEGAQTSSKMTRFVYSPEE